MVRPHYTVAQPRSGETPVAIYEFLRPLGNPTGSPEATGDYRGTDPELFVYSHKKTFRMTSLTIQISAESMSEGDFRPGSYGNISGGLDVGIMAGMLTDVPVITQFSQFSSNFKVRTLSDWATITSWNSIFLNKFGAPGLQSENGMATLIWDIASYSGAIRIGGDVSIGVVLNDDFSSLSSHLFYVQGYEEVV